jgi:phage repressor protein C with HTH and peptisase S24 domain
VNIQEIIDRLKEHLGIRTNIELAQKLGVVSGTVSNWKKRDRINHRLILDRIQTIDYHWLITGQAQESNTQTKSYEELQIATISSQDFLQKETQGLKLPIVIIPEKAYAGYSAGFSQEYHQELAVMTFKNYTNGYKYRCFEIKGDSMENLMESGDYVLCEKADKQALKDGIVYVFCTSEDVLCKRLEIAKTELILHSENPKYKPKTIDKQDFREIWRVIWIHRQVI